MVGMSDINQRLLISRTSNKKSSSSKLTESQFLNTADLREMQLMDMNNEILDVAP
jgi:hypothetical protein